MIDNTVEKICFICYQPDNELSFQPCLCNHSVHIDCLMNWIMTKNQFTCEICLDDYKISKDKYKNFIETFNEKLTDINYLQNNIENSDRYNNLIINQSNINNRQIMIENHKKTAAFCIAIIFISLFLIFLITQ